MEQSNLLNIHSVLEYSTVNGPGRRSVVWFQGCNLDCKGCFNIPIKEIRENKLMDVDTLLEMLPLKDIEGITISGGEPFLQIKQLYQLVNSIKKRGLTVMIYTGYYKRELLKLESIEVFKILDLTDILIDGPYIKDSPSRHPWAGSGNQSIIIKNKEYLKYYEYKSENIGEIIITDSGEVLETGFSKII